MTGMPWQLSYAASADLDNSELQTDVMRFMAILAFCLVAIFAIVQTMPLEAQQPGQSVSRARDRDIPDSTRAAQPVARPLPVVARLPAPTPKRPSLPAQSMPESQVASPAPVRRVVKASVAAAPEPVQMPEPVTVPPKAESLPDQTEQATTVATPTTGRGLSLAFESDAVLRSLVERRQVGLYAIDGKQFFEMAVSASRIEFSPGSAPAQYHEMVFETVPRGVAEAFESQQATSARNVVWGVTLPAATTSQLRRFIQTHFTGSLVITTEGQLALAGGG